VAELKLKWLKSIPKGIAGVSWGVPWEKGKLYLEDSICLETKQGEKVPLQSWPTAYWSDGSVKWTGHSAVIDSNEDTFELTIGENKKINTIVYVEEKGEQVVVNTGLLQIHINKQGTNIIEEIYHERKLVSNDIKLIAMKEFWENQKKMNIRREVPLESKIQHVEIEQKGPIKAVIKITGNHYVEDFQKRQSELPFQLRLYFYAGTASMNVVHTFFYDGDPHADFIKGIGIEVSTIGKGEDWNRHIHFGGDEGLYTEPAQLLLSRRLGNAEGLYDKQISGEIVQLNQTKNCELLNLVEQNPIWNDFKLTQDSADHYKIKKRTNEQCSWIEATHGTRAKGFVYTGGINGGIGCGIKNFWQKHPSSLEVTGLSTERPKIRLWFWSPDVEAMDLRHYDTKAHVESAYEGFDEMRATPTGIANTSEAFLQWFFQPPTKEELIDRMNDWQSPLLLVCEPEYYYKTKALGIWGLPDTTHPVKAKLEAQLNEAVSFYKNEIDQRRWYGYWHYGDVMHTYDPVRHQWRYDFGGYAWQNTELVPNIWLWYAFLRSGREDIFIMAEAMTRHTSEVDCYHFGEYAGLGSRHNVVHWGCGCKEARISMAGLHKIYYYLTTDERTGDLLHEVRDADKTIGHLDPMREFYPKDGQKTHARIGPDWAAFCSNWFTEWERTQDKQYLQKIIKGISGLKTLPLRLLSGPTFGYEPETNELIHIGDGKGAYHMVIAFGAPQAWIEIAQELEDAEFENMLIEFGEFYVLSNEEKSLQSDGILHDKLFSLPMLAAGMVAYAAAKKKDLNLAETAWNLLLDNEISEMCLPIETKKVKTWRTLTEVADITTNTTSQWCLNTIMALELIGEYLPNDMSKKVLL